MKIQKSFWLVGMLCSVSDGTLLCSSLVPSVGDRAQRWEHLARTKSFNNQPEFMLCDPCIKGSAVFVFGISADL